MIYSLIFKHQFDVYQNFCIIDFINESIKLNRERDGGFFGNLLSAISGDKIYFSFIIEIYEIFSYLVKETCKFKK